MAVQDLSSHIPLQRKFIIYVIIATALHFPKSCFANSDVGTDERSHDGSCSCSGQRDSIYGQLHDGKNNLKDVTSSSTEEIKTYEKHSSLPAIAENYSTNQSDATSRNLTEDSTQFLKVDEMVYISGGLFFMGTNDPLIPGDGEGPRRLVNLSDFMIDRF